MPTLPHCPNGHPVANPNLSFCPQCGAPLLGGPTRSGGGGLITGFAFLDVVLGVIVALLPLMLSPLLFANYIWLLAFIWLFMNLALYFRFRLSHPYFVWGIKAAFLPLLLLLLLFLGLLATCAGLYIIGTLQSTH